MSFEIHIVVDAPAVCDAVNNLVAVLRTKPEVPKVGSESKVPVAVPVQTETPANQTAAIQPTYIDPAPVVQPHVQQFASAPVPASQPVVQPPVDQHQAPTDRQYTVDEISRAGAALLDQPGKMGQLVTLLGKYGVPSIVNLNPNQYAAFAADLRTLGAKI